VIETSGLALPKPLVQAFAWPEIRTRTTVDGVIAVIDAAAVASGRFADDPAAVARQRAADPAIDHDNPLEEVFTDQLACADLVILNKTDLVAPERLATLRREIEARLRPGVKLIAAEQGRVAAPVALGLAAQAEDDLAARPSLHEIEGEHDHDDFESFVVNTGPIADLAEFRARLGAVIREHDVLRVKGFVDVPDRDRRQVVQAVGDRVQQHFDRPWLAGEARATRLVVIGKKGLDRGGIAAGLGVGRLLGGSAYWPYGVERLVETCRDNRIPLALLPGDDKPDPELARLSTVGVEAWRRLWRDLAEGGPGNADNFLRYAASLI